MAVFPELRHFSKIQTYFCKKITYSFDSGNHIEAKRTHFRFCPVTDRHTDGQIASNTPPTLGLTS